MVTPGGGVPPMGPRWGCFPTEPPVPQVPETSRSPLPGPRHPFPRIGQKRTSTLHAPAGRDLRKNPSHRNGGTDPGFHPRTQPRRPVGVPLRLKPSAPDRKPPPERYFQREG